MPTCPEGPVGNAVFLSEMDIRIWLRDHDPTANLLIKDLEFSTEEIRTAATLAVDAFNEEPPNMNVANYTVQNFPFRYNLLQGTVANLLTMAGHLYRRNELKYNVPGGSVDDQAKGEDYDRAADRLAKGYMSWVRRKKREINTSRGWGRI